MGTDNCDRFAKCTDLPDGFKCECNDGFTGDGVTCDGKLNYVYVMDILVDWWVNAYLVNIKYVLWSG